MKDRFVQSFSSNYSYKVTKIGEVKENTEVKLNEENNSNKSEKENTENNN